MIIILIIEPIMVIGRMKIIRPKVIGHIGIVRIMVIRRIRSKLKELGLVGRVNELIGLIMGHIKQLIRPKVEQHRIELRLVRQFVRQLKVGWFLEGWFIW